MKKALIAGMTTGISIMSIPIPSIKDLIISIFQKLFGIDTLNINPLFCIIFGALFFIICLIAYLKYDNKERIINIVGFGNNEYWERNNRNVETFDLRNWNKISDKSKFLKQKLKDIDKCINKYLASGISYTSIAPIPLVAIVGTHFSKIKINNYYEYVNKNSEVKRLNESCVFPRLKLNIINKNSINDYALITIGTTAEIKEHQISQFNKCLHYDNKISKPKQNSIYSKKQLFNYSNKIIEQINKISSIKNIKKIYLVFATQSSLPFEVGKQLNERMAKAFSNLVSSSSKV